MWGRTTFAAPARRRCATCRVQPEGAADAIEEQFQFTNGPSPVRTRSKRASLPAAGQRRADRVRHQLAAFEYGDGPDGPRRARVDDVRKTYMRCLDTLGANLIMQDEANPGRWPTIRLRRRLLAALEWMTSTWRSAADPDVHFAYNVTSMMVGHLAT